MSAADELRAAATRLEDLAAETSPGPWVAENGDDSWSLHSGPKQILKAPKHSTPYAEYWPDEADAAWIVGMGPQIAAPLAAWLSDAARMRRNAESVHEGDRRILRLSGNGAAADALADEPMVAPVTRNALAVARAINGTAS